MAPFLGIAAAILIFSGCLDFPMPDAGVYVSDSVKQSQENGFFVAEYSVEPHAFSYPGREIQIKEAWLEKPDTRAWRKKAELLGKKWPVYVVVIAFGPQGFVNMPNSVTVPGTVVGFTLRHPVAFFTVDEQTRELGCEISVAGERRSVRLSLAHAP